MLKRWLEFVNSTTVLINEHAWLQLQLSFRRLSRSKSSRLLHDPYQVLNTGAHCAILLWFTARSGWQGYRVNKSKTLARMSMHKYSTFWNYRQSIIWSTWPGLKHKTHKTMSTTLMMVRDFEPQINSPAFIALWLQLIHFINSRSSMTPALPVEYWLTH